MGVAIKDILEFEEIELSKLNNKRIAVDSFNMLYSFLASIRQADGMPLRDSKGEITSHLKGLFNRCVYFKKNNIRAVFIFDGEAPKLKEKEREIRAQKKIEANEKYKEALDMGLAEEAKKYAQGINKLDTTMIEESKKLISLFGFPVITAPSEAEAQASRLVREKKVFACSSQDFDSLLFGSNYLVRNLSISNRRKVPGSHIYKEVPIEFYDLDYNLRKLNINLDELIIVGILCGTDFNPGGVKGIGPKKALKIVKEYRGRFNELFKVLDWHSYFSYTWVDVFNTFKKIKTTQVDKIEFKDIDKKGVLNFLLEKDFDKESLNRSLKQIKNTTTLDKFF